MRWLTSGIVVVTSIIELSRKVFAELFVDSRSVVAAVSDPCGSLTPRVSCPSS